MTHDSPTPFPPRRAPLSWVFALFIASLLLLPPLSSAHADEADETDVATLDWTLAETLLALGVTPQGVAQIEAYHDWVGTPRIPASVADLGLRTQPNLELLASLDPGHILISPMFASLKPRLSRIAPVTNIGIYAPDSDPWASMLTATRQVADVVGKPDAAERLIERTQAHLAQARQRLPEETPPLLLVQFMDARHVRVFGESGLYQAVLEHLGLDNAWTGPTNYWGFSLVGLEALANIDAQLVVIEPLPVGVEAQLAESGLWRNLSAVRQDRVMRLSPVWSFGALPSARRFADLLVEALTSTEADANA